MHSKFFSFFCVRIKYWYLLFGPVLQPFFEESLMHSYITLGTKNLGILNCWHLILDFLKLFITFYVGSGFKSGSGTGTVMHSGSDKSKRYGSCGSGSTNAGNSTCIGRHDIRLPIAQINREPPKQLVQACQQIVDCLMETVLRYVHTVHTVLQIYCCKYWTGTSGIMLQKKIFLIKINP